MKIKKSKLLSALAAVGMSYSVLGSAGAMAETIKVAIPIGISEFRSKRNLVVIPFDKGEVDSGFLFVGQLRNRPLPVAAAKFVEGMRTGLES